MAELRSGHDPLHEVIFDIVFGSPHHVEEPPATQRGEALGKSEHPVESIVVARGLVHGLAQAAGRESDFGIDLDAGVKIVAPVVFLVRVVWLVVVFKAIDPTVVVQINAKEKLGPVDLVAQKRLVVVREKVLPLAVAVLVEVGKEVPVFVVAGKNRWIGHAIGPDPEILPRNGNQTTLKAAQLIWMPVVVVVVIDKVIGLDDGFGRVVNQAATIHWPHVGAVSVVHAEAFEKKVPRADVPRQVDHVGHVVLVSNNAGNSLVFLEGRRGVFAIAGADVELSVEIEPVPIAHLSGNAVYLARGGQPIVKGHLLLVEAVLDVTRCSRDR